MKPITFSKMSGSGNDFIIIDNRDRVVDEIDLPGFIRWSAAEKCRWVPMD